MLQTSVSPNFRLDNSNWRLLPALRASETMGESGADDAGGYGIFYVGATARPNVKTYIANQREHHRVKTYREELIEMLEKAGVEFEPKYLD